MVSKDTSFTFMTPRKSQARVEREAGVKSAFCGKQTKDAQRLVNTSPFLLKSRPRILFGLPSLHFFSLRYVPSVDCQRDVKQETSYKWRTKRTSCSSSWRHSVNALNISWKPQRMLSSCQLGRWCVMRLTLRNGTRSSRRSPFSSRDAVIIKILRWYFFSEDQIVSKL